MSWKCKRQNKKIHEESSIHQSYKDAGTFYIFNHPLLRRHNERDCASNLGVSIVCSGADKRKHQSSMSLVFVSEFTGDWWIPRTKGQVTRKRFLFDDVIMPTDINDISYISHFTSGVWASWRRKPPATLMFCPTVYFRTCRYMTRTQKVYHHYLCQML